MVERNENPRKSPLTVLPASGGQSELSAGQRQHLERDRWPEFERELWQRRPRRHRFGVTHYRVEEKPRWEWMIWRCRTWTEVERVLNRHRVDWSRERGELVVEGAMIFRCR